MSTCAQKATDFDQRQQLRGEEIQAIEKAIEIMSGGAVAVAQQHLPALAQRSLLQISAVLSRTHIEENSAEVILPLALPHLDLNLLGGFLRLTGTGSGYWGVAK